MTRNSWNLGKTNTDRGFTLIELLVVVAIIGVLSGVVLASLSGAREDARETAILQSLNNARTQAELYRNQNGNFSGLCENSQIQQIAGSLENTADGVACHDVSFEDSVLDESNWSITTEIDGTY